MITLSEIKKSLSNHQEVCLVGPLIKRFTPKNMPYLLVDGGSVVAPKLKGKLYWCIGDGDSSKNKMDLKLNPIKDFSDLKFALDCLPKSISIVHMKGFLGGRKDHELINFGEVHSFLKKRKSTAVHFSSKIKGYSAGDYQLNLKCTFSVIVFEKVRLSLKGDLQYPMVAKEIAPLSSLTLSNHGFGLVKIVSRGPFFIFQN